MERLEIAASDTLDTAMADDDLIATLIIQPGAREAVQFRAVFAVCLDCCLHIYSVIKAPHP